MAERGFHAAAYASPLENPYGLVLFDTAGAGANQTYYWCESPKDLIEFCYRFAPIALCGLDEGDTDRIAEHEEAMARLIAQYGGRRRFGELARHLRGASFGPDTDVGWIGTFDDLCKDADLRAAFWEARAQEGEESDETPRPSRRRRAAPPRIPRDLMESFAEFVCVRE